MRNREHGATSCEPRVRYARLVSFAGQHHRNIKEELLQEQKLSLKQNIRYKTKVCLFTTERFSSPFFVSTVLTFCAAFFVSDPLTSPLTFMRCLAFPPDDERPLVDSVCLRLSFTLTTH
jgi:hypothetical protein